MLASLLFSPRDLRDLWSGAFEPRLIRPFPGPRSPGLSGASELRLIRPFPGPRSPGLSDHFRITLAMKKIDEDTEKAFC